MQVKKDIEEYIVDAITGRPHCFSVGNRHFALYPLTLGKMLLLQEVISTIGINQELLKEDVTLEALRLVKKKKDGCLTVIAYHTFNRKEDILDVPKVEERVEYLRSNLSDEEIATLFLAALSSDKTDIIKEYFGIDKETDRMAEVMKVKDTKNTISFGGKSQYGILIDAACERYGWTKDYVIWGIDYTSLRLMLADKVSSVYLSDDELKKVPALLLGNDSMNASNPDNANAILASMANRGVKLENDGDKG